MSGSQALEFRLLCSRYTHHVGDQGQEITSFKYRLQVRTMYGWQVCPVIDAATLPVGEQQELHNQLQELVSTGQEPKPSWVR